MRKLILLAAALTLFMRLESCHSQVTVSDVIGVWEGTLHSFGQESRLIYKIYLREDGTLAASHDIPDYSLNEVPVTAVELAGNRLVLKIGLYEGLFEGIVGKGIIHGQYGTDLVRMPLTLWRKSTDPGFLLENMVPRLGRDGKPLLGYHYVPPVEGDDAWEAADAVTAGVDTSRVGMLIRRVLSGEFPNLHSILVIKDSKLIIDEYFHGFHHDKPHRISSVSKVVTESLIGIMLQQGLIRDIHTPLCEIFPAYADLLCAGDKKQITLYHLLTMTTGLQWNEHAVSYFDHNNDLSILKSSPDPLRTLFERPLIHHPGDRFVYNTGCIIALETLIQNISKAHYLLYAQKELFNPMSISNIRWDYSEGLYMLPRDMAKLGWLFLKRGEYKGLSILSPAWADSALERFERDRPRYFNHWSPIVFFANGIPVQALQAGGWGGQSITIVPALNSVIVMTGANQLEPADYDLCIRDYLLPAIMTPLFLTAHPQAAYAGIHTTKNLQWEMHWNTEMGCIKAAARSLGRDLSNAQLYGGTGVGFLINIDERAEAKSMAVWNWHGAYGLCPNLGFSIESIWMHKSNPAFYDTQKLVWNRVRSAIDSGYVCYGFDLDNTIRTIILGYDKIGYYHTGWEAEKGKGPLYWYELGDTEIGLLGMHFVRPVAVEVPYSEMVKKALQFVLEFTDTPAKWVPGDCAAGPAGFARWIALIESGKEDGYGLSYNGAELAEARGYAVAFLEEAGSRSPDLAPLFAKASRHYQRAARELDALSHAFPHTAPVAERNRNLQDPVKRAVAIRCLRAAREAEIEGLKTLQIIVNQL
jgi:CubicO group peptidase (beta-lactamase class C family)